MGDFNRMSVICRGSASGPFQVYGIAPDLPVAPVEIVLDEMPFGREWKGRRPT